MSANSLLNGSTPSVIPNVPSTNPLYNPSIPVMGDQSVRSLRNINMKDRFYLDNAIDGQMKNNDGLSLGANNKFLRRNDYDRQIDPNYLRRENPKNRKHTDPDDFYNGSQLAYFQIPRKIPRAQIANPLSAVDPMDMYQYKNRFISNPVLSQPKVNIQPSKNPEVTTDKSMSDKNTIGFDPTDDPAIKKILDDIEKEKQQSRRDRNVQNSLLPPSSIDTTQVDKYGNPTLNPPMNIIPKGGAGTKGATTNL